MYKKTRCGYNGLILFSINEGWVCEYRPVYNLTTQIPRITFITENHYFDWEAA